jgi:hypothetical protein
VLDRLYALLDNQFLSRLGNLRTLVSVAGVVGVVLIALVLALVHVFAHASWVPLLFLGLAFLLALILGLGRLRTRRERRAAADPVLVAGLADRLQSVADRVEGFVHAREVEEPRRPQPSGLGRGLLSLESEMAAAETEHYEALVAYRKKTMALYYEQHRADAVNAFNACAVLGYTRGRERESSIIYKPNGTAALALVPGILRDMAWKLTGA